MNAPTRIATALTVGLVSVGLLTGCSSHEHTERKTFPWQDQTLRVKNDNDNMPVTVTSDPAKRVTVSVTTVTAVKKANTPAWTLNGSVLDLDSPCKEGYFGVCEGNYAITVPTGTKVTVNGDRVPVG